MNNETRKTMQIQVVRYTPSSSPLVQAFVDVVVNGWLRVNGLNFDRDGRLRPPQLTPCRRSGPRLFFDAIEVTDPDLRESVAAAILAAIHQHLETLPPEQRVLPPRPPEPRKTDQRPQVAPANGKPLPAKPQPTATLAEIARASARTKNIQPVNAKPPAVPPPARLLVSRRAL
jgi:hypothetical protein